jgi:teichuronic acid biosynthesis glycosyltransferase TuaG
MSGDLISIIMPAYNAEAYIGQAIRSVLDQDHENWELIVVNDGSTDRSGDIAGSFKDERIRVIHQENKGIGGARNAGLAAMKGELLATLDADDILPAGSLSSRLAVLRDHPEASFVDGSCVIMDRTLEQVIKEYVPDFEGEPLSELVGITGRCFFGTTWLIRLDKGMRPRFDEGTTHGEDLLFYMSLAKGRTYRYTTSPVYIYRRTGESAMSDLDGLMRGYDHILQWLIARPEFASQREVDLFRRRTRAIAVKSYLKAGYILKAVLYLIGLRRPRSRAPVTT